MSWEKSGVCKKSIEGLEVTVKENKNKIKSLMDRTKALETQKG